MVASARLGEQRLQQRVNELVGQQYRVISQTPTTAQLVKPKRFSFLWFALWLVLMVAPALVYVLYHLFLKRERQVYLSLNADGTLSETHDKR